MDTSFITINAHSSIRLEAQDGTVIYVDPYLFETAPHDADLILVTHSHHDHYSVDDIARVRKDSTRFVAPASMTDELPEAALVSPGGSCEPIPGIRVEAVPAATPGRPFHPRRNNWVGYVVELDGTRVYIAGDTDNLPENRSISCDIALVPVGGFYTMDYREAAAFVNAMRPAVAIPEHYGSGVVGKPEDGERFAKLVDPSIEVVLKL